MGRRGPQPAPTPLKLLHGVAKSRINFDEPQAPIGIPPRPTDMSPECASVWDHLVGYLDGMQIVSPMDEAALRVFCEAVANHRRATRIIDRAGVLINGDRGIVRNPAIMVQNIAAQQIRSFGQEFGLTPAARSQIVTGNYDSRSESNAERLLS